MRFATFLVGLGLAGCAINARKGPHAPSESKVSSNPSADSTVNVNVGTPTRGGQLYDRYCADCHNPLETSTKRKATAADIQRGINNVSEMADLDRLRRSDIASIVEALK